MRRMVGTISALIAAVCIVASPRAVVAQGGAADRADQNPRFLLASASTLVRMNAEQAPVLGRRLALDLDGVTLKEALATIAARSGLDLFYGDDAVPLERRVHLKTDGITVAAALTDLLFGVGVDVVFNARGGASLVRREMRKTTAVGSVAGRVTDAKTQTALAGATVVVQGTSRSATTGSDGRYRIADVAPGTYTVRARYIGYAPGAATVTVSADQEATADFTLEKSAQQLNEVVTTGTVVPTEVKALPTPISVITGDEIQQKGYQRVDQIFRGDVPGALAWDQGPYNYYSTIKIRGASDLGSGNSNAVKTYVDGVEVANADFIAMIDPNSIERIEVLRGPQGSTIYGSQAIGGVMQIFTKKGEFNLPHPQVEAKGSAGALQSPWGNTAQTDNSLAVSGGGPDFSFRFGGAYLHNGDWVPPQSSSTNTGLYGGVRAQQGPVTIALSARYYAKTFAFASNPDLIAINPALLTPVTNSFPFRQQTYGLTVNYAATPYWHHNVALGYDHTAHDYYEGPGYKLPSDTFSVVSSFDEAKPSVAYNTTFEAPLGNAAHTSLTAGVDHWTYQAGGFDAYRTTSIVNTIPSPDAGYRYHYSNTGYFAQAQLELWHALFVTGGLRAEDNQNFGQDFGLAWAPRVGASYVHTMGDVTAKFRVSYGKAIRPPDPGIAQTIVTATYVQLGSPNLGPSQQVGADGGIELYFGQRGSLAATYYNQTATAIDCCVTISDAPLYTYQAQNVGTIRNKGWEFEGRLNAGRLSLTGTYSIVHSVVQTLSPSYSGAQRPGDQVLAVPKHSGGATVSYGLPHTDISLGMTYVGSWINTDYLALYGHLYGGQPSRGASRRDYWITYPSFAKFNVAVSQVLTSRFSVFLQSNNLANEYVTEGSNLAVSSGRMTLIGIRTKF